MPVRWRRRRVSTADDQRVPAGASAARSASADGGASRRGAGLHDLELDALGHSPAARQSARGQRNTLVAAKQRRRRRVGEPARRSTSLCSGTTLADEHGATAHPMSLHGGPGRWEPAGRSMWWARKRQSRRWWTSILDDLFTGRPLRSWTGVARLGLTRLRRGASSEQPIEAVPRSVVRQRAGNGRAGPRPVCDACGLGVWLRGRSAHFGRARASGAASTWSAQVSSP